MLNDLDDVPVLYSVGTLLAYKIAQKYYKNTHYVWCTTKFNTRTQPITSNPQTICRRYLEQIITSDRHTVEIERNKVGILAGAKMKLNQGIISDDQYSNIKNIVAYADFESFFPVIYIIYTDRVKNKCNRADKVDCASDTSIEFKIECLKNEEFDIINLYDIFNGLIDYSNREVGE